MRVKIENPVVTLKENDPLIYINYKKRLDQIILSSIIEAENSNKNYIYFRIRSISFKYEDGMKMQIEGAQFSIKRENNSIFVNEKSLKEIIENNFKEAVTIGVIGEVIPNKNYFFNSINIEEY